MMELHKKAIPHKRDSLFDCRSSTKTAHETSTTYEVEWLQSTVCRYWDVVPPPRPPTRQAQRAKARGCGLRRVGVGECPPPELLKKRVAVKLTDNNLQCVSAWMKFHIQIHIEVICSNIPAY